MKISCLAILGFGIISCSPKNLLSYPHSKNYLETNTYQNILNTVILRNSYRRPSYKSKERIDVFGINYMIPDSVLLKGKTKFDLISDSSQVWVFFMLPNISFLESGEKYKLKGTIEILHWDSSKIILKQNIDVLDNSLKVVKYIRGHGISQIS